MIGGLKISVTITNQLGFNFLLYNFGMMTIGTTFIQNLKTNAKIMSKNMAMRRRPLSNPKAVDKSPL